MTFCVLYTWCGCAAQQQTSPWGRSLSLSGNISCAARLLAVGFGRSLICKCVFAFVLCIPRASGMIMCPPLRPCHRPGL